MPIHAMGQNMIEQACAQLTYDGQSSTIGGIGLGGSSPLLPVGSGDS